MPSAVGYQPTLCTEMGSIQERIVATKLGSITSIQAIFVPADDLTDPAPAIIFGHLDAITVLSRALAAKAIYPAVDPFNSTSKMLSPSHILTRIQGSYVSLDETIHGFSQIVNGSLDNWSEGAFYLKGTIS